MTITLKVGQVWIDLRGSIREIIAIKNRSTIKYAYTDKTPYPPSINAVRIMNFRRMIKNSRLETRLEKALRDLKSGE